MNWAKDWLVTAVYPNRCSLCGAVIPWGDYLCDRCREEAPVVYPPVCEHCGRGEEYCACRRHRRLFERCVSPYYYTDTVRQTILEMKNGGWRTTVTGLTVEMAEVVRREYGGIGFAGVMPVPMYPADERLRGFNPSALLAEELAARLGTPFTPELKKLIRTKPQKELPAERRSGNVLGAFDVVSPERVRDRRWLLVDDVITTGSTLEECAKMLKIYGAAEVYAVTAAAALLDEEKYCKNRRMVYNTEKTV